jgi:hypothetical protein
MARCVSSHSGISKIQYPSRKRARIALEKFVAREPGAKMSDFDIYRCRECREIHFGHKKEQPQTDLYGPPLRELPRLEMARLYAAGTPLPAIAEFYRFKDLSVLQDWLRPVMEKLG